MFAAVTLYSDIACDFDNLGSYTIPERVKSHFGKNNVITAHISGKRVHMEVQNETGTILKGTYSREQYSLTYHPKSMYVGDRNASTVGPLTLQFIQNYSKSHFFAFFHFSDPDYAGHLGGENSRIYEQAIERCDYWLGQMVNKLNTLNITQKTLICVTADHGFDENSIEHNFALYIFLATNDKNMKRNGDHVDVAPTIYHGLGMCDVFNPAQDCYPLQVDLPVGVEQRRQNVLSDVTPPPKSFIISPPGGAELAGIVDISFKVSDKYLSAVLILIDNILTADGPWTWNHNNLTEANGAYHWDLTYTNLGLHTITILAFDEHGSTNSPAPSK